MHGPHIWNQRSHERLLRPLGVLFGVSDAEELARELQRLWAEPDRNAPARAAREPLSRHSGSADRVVELVADAYARVAGRA